MSEPRLTRLSKLDGEASATALAKYLLEASDAAALAGYLSIIVNVPKPFSLTIAEARAIADRLAGKDLRDARARIAELETALRNVIATVRQKNLEPFENERLRFLELAVELKWLVEKSVGEIPDE